MDSGGVVRGSRRLGIMYFIMISQQNCNLQRAMSHTTPTASSSSSSTSSLVARSFSPLSTLSSLAPRPDSPSACPFNLSRSDHFHRSVYPSLASCSSSSDRPSRSNRVSRSTHTCKPSLTSNSKELQLLSSSPLSSLLSQLAPQIAILFALILALFLSPSLSFSFYPS